MKTETFNIEIYRDGKLIETLENQVNDLKMYGKLHRLTSVSVDRAIRYEGFKVIHIYPNGDKYQLKHVNKYLDLVKID